MTPFSLEPQRDERHPAPRALEGLAFDAEPSHGDLQRHTQQCEECARVVAALRAERSAFLIQRPAKVFSAKIFARSKDRRAWLPLVGALAAGLIAVAVWWQTPIEPSVKLKGKPQIGLSVWLSRNGAGARPAEEPTFYAGDVLKFSVTLPEDGFVFIANVDGNGLFTRYFPAREERSVALRGGEQMLPGSVVLDDFIGEEQLILIFSKRSLHQSEIERALKSGVLDPLDAQWVRLAHRKIAP